MFGKLFEKPRYVLAGIGALIAIQGVAFIAIEDSQFSRLVATIGLTIVGGGLYVECWAALSETAVAIRSFFDRGKDRKAEVDRNQLREQTTTERESQIAIASEKCSSNQNGGETVMMWLVIGVFGLLYLLRNGDHSRHYIPTQREKDEAGVRALLKEYGRRDATGAEIREGAKDVVDEWDKVEK